MQTPFVSVLIDTYNHERFVERAITSVLEQDFPAANREILVVDDGSTDRTVEIVRKFNGQVRLLSKSNGGQASSFNVGIPECRGELIAFLDGDDWWAPAKLQRTIPRMAADAKIALLGHAIKESFVDGSENIVSPAKDERLTLNTLAAARVFRLRKCFLGTSRMTLRADVARQIIPVPETIVFEADEYLFTLAAAMGDAVILQDPLTHYRVHAGNLYLSAGYAGDGLRRKQRVLAALAVSLRQRLLQIGLAAEIVTCVIETVQAEANQLKLTMDGGFPWETLRTETKLYEVMHGEVSLSNRIFHTLTMAAAAILPPKWFYGGRRWLGRRSWYRWARESLLPVPKITTVASQDEFKA